MEKKRIVYWRVSLDKQEAESQRNALIERVAQYKGEVVWLGDKATGTNADREDYQKMLNQIRAGWVQDVTVYKLDRAGRSMMDNLILAEVCKKTKTDIISHADGFNLFSPSGELMFNLLSSFAAYERKCTSDRTKEGMKLAKLKDKIIGGSAPGSVRRKILAVVPELKLLRANGYTPHRIAKVLKINRKSVLRIFAKIDAGEPLLSHAEVMATIPLERRGKAFQEAYKVMQKA